MRHAEFSWVVPDRHPAFAGHFPGQPIVPGVLLVDWAILLVEAWLEKPPLAWQIGSAKFHAPVAPGARLAYQLQERPGAVIAFSVRAGAREVAAGSLKPAA